MNMQFLAGSASQSTPGMNFIPPISCGMPNEVDEIPSVQSIGNTNYTGGIFAITEAGANLTIDGTPQAGGNYCMSNNFIFNYELNQNT